MKIQSFNECEAVNLNLLYIGKLTESFPPFHLLAYHLKDTTHPEFRHF